MPRKKKGRPRAAFRHSQSVTHAIGRDSTAADPPTAVTRLLAFAEEGRVIRNRPFRMFFHQVPDVVVVVRHPTAQSRGLHQAAPGALVDLILAGGYERGAHVSNP